MNKIKLSSNIEVDGITASLSNAFDYEFSGQSETIIEYPDIPKEGIGLIVGPSGSGKSTILSTLGDLNLPEWSSGKSVCSHFKSKSDAYERLGAIGLNSVPSWVREYSTLSNGEKFRADLARNLNDGALIDEFTSVVDRQVAKSCCYAAQRYIRLQNWERVIFASCHYDIIEWLIPDWVLDMKTGLLSRRGSERRPKIVMEILPCTTGAWSIFRNHHYLSGNINKSSKCWVAEWNGQPVGFASAIAYPSGSVKNAWREHRTVVLPDFQGLGLGVRISDAIGEIFISEGKRYFSKTSNYRMGEYRERSSKWRPTSKNKKARPDYDNNRLTKESKNKHKHINRICYSHEYMVLSS